MPANSGIALARSRTVTRAELDDWASRCRAWASDGADVHVYFDNDREAQAAHDAVRLDGLLRGRTAGRSDPGGAAVRAAPPARSLRRSREAPEREQALAEHR